ncbi:MAG: protein tyrosine phosphatase family protein [Acidobacteria bacterium]|nr:protein tyrosine phosphatase family protein [Acidobacteriota bacterium]
MRALTRKAAFAAACLVAIPVVGEDAVAPGPTAVIDRASLPVKLTDLEGFERTICRDGRVFIAGQPTEAALERLKGLGVTAVVNLRTPKEMADRAQVPYDEAAAAARLGLEYVHIPLGGADFPYTPEAVDRFAAVLVAHPGPVLLHCTVAWRASYMWAAYLIRHGGLDLDAALARGRAIGISQDPLEGLLGRPIRLTLGDAPAAAVAPPAPKP